MNILQERGKLAKDFVCPICKGAGAYTNMISASGEYSSRLSKFQVFDFILVSCKKCGFSETYDLYFMGR